MPLLCATNFSPEAIAATTVAGELARQRGEDLWLVFVMPGETARAFGEDVFATADAALKGEASRLRKLGANVTPAVLIGKLHNELPRFAVENQVSLVIAGDSARDAGFLGTGVLGRLGQRLEVPLLAVRDPVGLIAWARGERPLKVMVGVDQTASTDVAVRWVEALGKFGKLEVVGAHVFFPAVEYHRLGLPLPQVWDEVAPELMGALYRELNAKLLGPIRFRPAIGRVSDHLNALAAEEKVDLLVLGTHHRRALGRLFSVSEQCLHSAPMSVVCVPASKLSAAHPPIGQVDRVLIATDFTPTGDRAVGWGVGIVAVGGTVDLVHVSASPLTVAEEKEITQQLLARIPASVAARGLTIRAHALVGSNAAQSILAAAERLTSSVICLGSRANAGIAKLVLGSTAQGVFEASKRPVLIVRPPEP